MDEFKNRRTWLLLILSGLVGWALTHLLDGLTRGTIQAWGSTLAIVSLGSVTVRDFPYRDAALNPYPEPSLEGLYFLLTTITAIAVSIVFWCLVIQFRRHSEDTQATKRRRIDWRKIAKYYSVVSIPGMVICITTLFIQVGMANESILIRRVYEADRDILTPKLSTTEVQQLQADFCSMQNKHDFESLMDKMNSLAQQRKVKLRTEKY